MNCILSDARAPEMRLKEEYLTCGVCGHAFDFSKYAPHQLPCGDTACLDCLRQFGKVARVFNSLRLHDNVKCYTAVKRYKYFGECVTVTKVRHFYERS